MQLYEMSGEMTGSPGSNDGSARRSCADRQTTEEGRELRYNPREDASTSSSLEASCRHCRYNDGRCQRLCADIRRMLPNEQTGKGRNEYTNELDLDGRTSRPARFAAPDFSKLLGAPHIYTGKQLAVLKLVHSGKSRSEICSELGVSSSRVSQLLRAAMERYDRREARMRALVLKELRKLSADGAEGDE